MFRDLSSTILSQFNSDTEKWQTDASWRKAKERVTDWLNGLVADFYDEGGRQACATSGQMPESQWGLRRKINILWHDAWKPEYGHMLGNASLSRFPRQHEIDRCWTTAN
jgi:hypothetical protein